MRILIEKFVEVYGKMNIGLVPMVIDTYNTNVHRTIKSRPIDVVGNDELIGKLKKMYRDEQEGGISVQRIENGSRVRVLIKNEDSKFAKTSPNWSKAIYTVQSFDRKSDKYKLSNGKEYRENQLQVIKGEVLTYDVPKPIARPTTEKGRKEEQDYAQKLGLLRRNATLIRRTRNKVNYAE